MGRAPSHLQLVALSAAEFPGYSSHTSPEKEGRGLGGPEAGGSKPTWPPQRANSSPTLPRRPSASQRRPASSPQGLSSLCRRQAHCQDPRQAEERRPGACSWGPSSGTWFTSGWGGGQRLTLSPPPLPQGKLQARRCPDLA